MCRRGWGRTCRPGCPTVASAPRRSVPRVAAPLELVRPMRTVSPASTPARTQRPLDAQRAQLALEPLAPIPRSRSRSGPRAARRARPRTRNAPSGSCSTLNDDWAALRAGGRRRPPARPDAPARPRPAAGGPAPQQLRDADRRPGPRSATTSRPSRVARAHEGVQRSPRLPAGRACWRRPAWSCRAAAGRAPRARRG